jgi:hypothetical protein
MNEPDMRAGIEVRLRKILDHYSQAASVGDFKEAILAVHTAIEEALNLDLMEADQILSFNEKVQQRYPDLYNYYQISEITRLRNHIAHPKRAFKEMELRPAALNFVDFTLSAWPDLFDSQPPVILHPGIAEQPSDPEGRAFSPPPPLPLYEYGPGPVSDGIEAIPPEPEPSPYEEKRAVHAPGKSPLPEWLQDLFHIPWHHLLYSFASAWMTVMAIGLMVQIYPTARTTTLLLFGIAMLIFAIASLGYLVHFLLRFGVRRIFATVLSLLVITTLFFTVRQPADMRWSTRLADGFGQALTSPLFWTNQIGRLAFESGQEFGQRYFPETREVAFVEEEFEESSIDQVMQTLFPSSEQPSATELPPVTVEEPSAGIYIGGQVRVDTDGTRLRSRDVPGLGGNVVIMFEPGELLQVIDGPVDADGYTWWKVENDGDFGWSAADFLTPIQ